jgi:hypothetical protein
MLEDPAPQRVQHDGGVVGPVDDVDGVGHEE